MSLKIALAHDFTCVWCWIGLQQVRRLRNEFDVEFDWMSFEQTPIGMDFVPPVVPDQSPGQAPVPSRLQLMLAAEGLQLPIVIKPRNVRTDNAHQAARFARRFGQEEALIERIYDAFWEEGKDINSVEVLMELSQGLVQDQEGMKRAIETKEFADEIVGFNEPAFAKGFYNIPTFIINGEKYAEQPYSVLRSAVAKAVDESIGSSLYADIDYVNPHQDRPFVFINMVTTIDGKIITGERGEPVGDLGSKMDHFLMHRLEAKADAILSGANSLRATGNNWNPKTHARIVVTASGNIPWESEFMTKGHPIVITSKSAPIADRQGVTIIRAGDSQLEWPEAFRQLKALGIERLNVLGGSEINAQLLTLGLVDELFMTLAPKIKLGAETPTYADGSPLPRELVQTYELVSSVVVGNEVFLRYRK